MGGVCDELAAGAVEVCEPQPHALERPRELAHLIRAVVDDRRVEVTGGDLLGCLLEPADAPSEHACAGIAEEHREGGRDRACHDHPFADDRYDLELVVKGGREHHDRRAERIGHLRVLLAAPRHRAPGQGLEPNCVECDRVVDHVGRVTFDVRVGVRDEQSRRLVLQVEDDHAGVDPRRERGGELLLQPRLGRVVRHGARPQDGLERP